MIKYFLFFVKTLPLSQIFRDGKFVFSKTESLFGQDGWRQKKEEDWRAITVSGVTPPYT